ncbi:MAG: tRNA modification GTPase TrmE [Verrucomicrobiaceae bacterium]|nr:tRNA modification GTPase TrmE [Verrucomicrobiaceae bacterium]
MLNDTIAAISTSLGEAAISVLRVTGPQALQVAEKVVRTRKPLSLLKPRQAHLANLVDKDGHVIDHAMLLRFQGPASYTGEDVVELHCHGGLLVTQRVLELLLAAGARAAEPGEFTQRAYLNGKMDITQAEAVMDLIHAQSTLAIRAANEQLEGSIGREAQQMREDLIHVLAHIEAFIDFPEEDISPETGDAMLARIDAVRSRVQRLLATAEHGRILRHGARTVICGEPNVGKSSLLNVLLGFERAIVSPQAGTTRDTIEEMLQVHGLPLRLVDTAGLREGGDEIERHGMQRTGREIDRADLVIEVVDGTRQRDEGHRVETHIDPSRHLLVLNKADLGIDASWSSDDAGIRVSSVSQEGIEALRAAIRDIVMRSSGSMMTDHPVAINARHKSCFERVAASLEATRESLVRQDAPEFIALEAREALQALGDVVGRVDIEEILDEVFSAFCIGK